MTGAVQFLPVPTRDTVRRLESKRWRQTAYRMILRSLTSFVEEKTAVESEEDVPINEELPPTRDEISL